jgi:hypothetical protein
MICHLTSAHSPDRSFASRLSRTCKNRALTPWLVRCALGLMLVALTASQAAAATYFVDPGTGADTNDGSSAGSAWASVPGSRTTDNTNFLHSQWGSISQTNKVKCGDTILLKGGATYKSGNGGALRIDPAFFTNTCSAASPIAIRVATNAQWSGSSGAFTISGTGMVVTSGIYQNADGTCQSGGYCGLVAIENLDGVIFVGASASQQIIVKNVIKSTNGGAKTAGVMVQGKGAAVGKDIQLGFLDISNKSAYDNGYGVEITDVGFSWVHDVAVHDWLGGGVDTSMMTTWHRVQSLVLEKITVTNTGNNSSSVYPVSDDYYFAGGEFSDKRNGGGIWCLNCVGANGLADGSNSFGCNGVGEDGLLRYRDSAFYGNGRNTALTTGNGIESAGDSATTCGGGGNALPEQTVISIRTVFYNNRRAGLSTPHNAGSHYGWHDTLYRASSSDSDFQHNECASSVGFFNSIVDTGSDSTMALGISNCGTAEGTNKTAPVMMNTLWRGTSTTRQLSQVRTFCRKDDGTWTTTPCQNGGCPSGQSCRTDYSSSVLCQSPCTGQSFSSPPGFLVGNGNVTGTQDTKFVSTGGRCDSAFVDGAPGYTDCDFHLQAGSPAIDPPKALFVLLANGAGSNASTINVKASTPEPEQMTAPIYGSLNLNWGSRPHIADPRSYFISPQNHPWATGDVIQIVGTCAHGAARHAQDGRAQITSMTATSITVDDTCTWNDGAGVHWPFNGSAPDMGAYEYGLDNSSIAAPVLLSVDPVQ